MDEESTEITEEQVAPEPPEEAFVAFQFGSVIRREQVTITFPGMDPKWYVTAQAPDAQGAKRIEAAPLRFSDAPAGDSVELSPNTYAMYLAKCEGQIVDFCLPQLDEHGSVIGEVRYNHKFPGANKAVYDSLNEAAMNYVEGALDKIAGRDTRLSAEYERVKNACAPSASTG